MSLNDILSGISSNLIYSFLSYIITLILVGFAIKKIAPYIRNIFFRGAIISGKWKIKYLHSTIDSENGIAIFEQSGDRFSGVISISKNKNNANINPCNIYIVEGKVNKHNINATYYNKDRPSLNRGCLSMAYKNKNDISGLLTYICDSKEKPTHVDYIQFTLKRTI